MSVSLLTIRKEICSGMGSPVDRQLTRENSTRFGRARHCWFESAPPFSSVNSASLLPNCAG